MWRFSPRSEEAEPSIGLSKLGDVLPWKDEPLESLALEASGSNFWESQRAVGNQESAHRELTHTLIFSKSQGRSNSLKNTEDIREGDSPTNLGTFARGQGSSGTVSGNENTDRCHFFIFFSSPGCRVASRCRFCYCFST